MRIVTFTFTWRSSSRSSFLSSSTGVIGCDCPFTFTCISPGDHHHDHDHDCDHDRYWSGGECDGSSAARLELPAGGEAARHQPVESRAAGGGRHLSSIA